VFGTDSGGFKRCGANTLICILDTIHDVSSIATFNMKTRCAISYQYSCHASTFVPQLNEIVKQEVTMRHNLRYFECCNNRTSIEQRIMDKFTSPYARTKVVLSCSSARSAFAHERLRSEANQRCASISTKQL
jgi:hypothetical protein